MRNIVIEKDDIFVNVPFVNLSKPFVEKFVSPELRRIKN